MLELGKFSLLFKQCMIRGIIMKRSIAGVLAVFCALAAAHAEFRVWSSKDGSSNVEAQFIQMSGSKVVLEKPDGGRLMVPADKLCAKDQEYLAGVVPPEFKIDVNVDESTIKLHDSGYSTKERDNISVDVTIGKASKAPCSQSFRAYLYVIAESYRGDGRVVICKTDTSFSFEKGKPARLETSGSVAYWDTSYGGKMGWEYEGYIVVIENAEGQIIATKANKSAYEGKLQKIRKCKVSKADTYTYYDDDYDIFEL
jgi:hypothetical protein